MRLVSGDIEHAGINKRGESEDSDSYGNNQSLERFHKYPKMFGGDVMRMIVPFSLGLGKDGDRGIYLVCWSAGISPLLRIGNEYGSSHCYGSDR
jgi:hypothetical protein